jgi:stage V sporulation protein SpoVS
MNGKVTSIVTKTLKFSANDAKMSKSVSTTMMETKKQRDHNPATIVFKVPAAGKTVSWTYKTIQGDNLKCTASWTTMNIDGEERKTIKIIQEYEGLTSRSIEYYVKGIGLYKTDLDDLGNIQTEDKFDSLNYEQIE